MKMPYIRLEGNHTKKIDCYKKVNEYDILYTTNTKFKMIGILASKLEYPNINITKEDFGRFERIIHAFYIFEDYKQYN